MFERAPQHLALVILWLMLAASGLRLNLVPFGSLGGLSTTTWYVIALGLAMTQQFYLWFAWRSELHHQWMTKTLGRFAFEIHALIFATLTLLRLSGLVLLSFSNRGTSELPQISYWPIVLMFTFLALVTLDQVQRYFSLRRALGADHFWPEEYRRLGIERRGIFRHLDNPMYTFGALFLWLPGLILESQAGILAAALQHLYLWIHLYTVEIPDMRRIYGASHLS
jgi:protein-S-isoprenylcysteine O-methyltransferase Ste14